MGIRPSRVRAKGRLSKVTLPSYESTNPSSDDDDMHELHKRPTNRSQCKGGQRPCPWVSCRHHLAIEVNAHGSLVLVQPDVDVWDLRETCSLDVADRGGRTLEEVGRDINLTRERVRQIEAQAIMFVRVHLADLGFDPFPSAKPRTRIEAVTDLAKAYGMTLKDVCAWAYIPYIGICCLVVNRRIISNKVLTALETAVYEMIPYE